MKHARANKTFSCGKTHRRRGKIFSSLLFHEWVFHVQWITLQTPSNPKFTSKRLAIEEKKKGLSLQHENICAMIDESFHFLWTRSRTREREKFSSSDFIGFKLFRLLLISVWLPQINRRNHRRAQHYIHNRRRCSQWGS